MAIGLVRDGRHRVVDYRTFRDCALRDLRRARACCWSLVVSPLGSTSKGTQAWFQLGLVPAPAVRVRQARADPRARRGVRRSSAASSTCAGWSRCSALAGLPLALIMLQPDLGTALVLVVITAGMLLVGGAQPKHLARARSCVGVVGVAWCCNSDVLEEYQKDRLTVVPRPGRTTWPKAALQPQPVEDRHRRGRPFGAGPVRRAARPGSATCPSSTPTSSSRRWARSSASSGAATLLALFCDHRAGGSGARAQLARDDFGTLVCVGVLAMLCSRSSRTWA